MTIICARTVHDITVTALYYAAKANLLFLAFKIFNPVLLRVPQINKHDSLLL